MDFITLEEIILLTLANVSIGAWLIFHFSEQRIKSLMFAWGSEFKNEFLKEIEENPQTLTKILQPAIPSLINAFQQSLGSKGGGEMIKLPLIGKVPARFLDMGMGILQKKAAETAQEAVNTFG